MGVELTQWTVVRSRGATGDNDDALGVIRLRSPRGDTRSFLLDGLAPAVRGELRDLGSGSKVPAYLLRAVLRAGPAEANVPGDPTRPEEGRPATGR